jgi:hypothetical protein
MEHSVFPPSVSPVSTREAQFRTEFIRLGSRMLLDVQTMSFPMSLRGHLTIWTTHDGASHSWLGDRADRVCDDKSLYDGLTSMRGLTHGLAGFIPYLLLGRADGICLQRGAVLVGTESVRGVRCTIVRLDLPGRRLDIWVDDANTIRLAREHMNTAPPVDQVVFFDPHFPTEVEESKFAFSPTAASSAPSECGPWLK